MLFLSLCLTFNILCHELPSEGQTAATIYYGLLKILLYEQKPSNLQKKSLFSKRYMIINVIVVENWKRCFKKQFLYLVRHKYRSHISKKICHSSLHFCNVDFSFIFPVAWACRLRFLWAWMVRDILHAWPTGGEWSLTITVSTNQSFCHNSLENQ